MAQRLRHPTRFVLFSASLGLAFPSCARAPAPAPAGAAPSAACEQARALRERAKEAYDAGRLLLARRRLDRAAGLCPAQESAGGELAFRIALALGDEAALSAAKQRGIPPFAGDVPPGLSPSASPEADYRRAARAFVDEQLEEAQRGAVQVALVPGGRLRAEAYLLAAQVARARGDEARWRRMLARAHHEGCPDGCQNLPRLPENNWFALAAAFPTVRPQFPSCVLGHQKESERGSGGEVLTPDGRYDVVAVPRGAEVRAIPSRVLVSWADADPGLLCWSAGARWHLHSGHSGYTLAGEAEAGKLQPINDTADDLLPTGKYHNLLVLAPDGVVYLHQPMPAGERLWHRASWHDSPGSALRFVPLLKLPRRFDPALLENGDLLGFDDGPRDRSYLLRVEGSTGKVLRRLGPFPRGEHVVVSPDNRRAFWVDAGNVVHAADLQSGAEKSMALGSPPNSPCDPVGDTSQVTEPCPYLEGLAGGSGAIFENLGWQIADIDTGRIRDASILADSAVGGHWQLGASRSRMFLATTDAVIAVDLATGGVGRYPLPSSVAGDVYAASVSDDGRWVAGELRGNTVAIFDVGDPKAPRSVFTRKVEGPHVEFVPGSAVVRVFSKGDFSFAYDASAGKEVPDLPGAPVAVSYKQPAREAEVGGTTLDLQQGFLQLRRVDEGKKERKLIARFSRDARGGMAIDDEGYYEIFGEVSPAFRAAASCGHDHPIEMCADRWEAPGVLAKFLRGDFSYKDP